MTQIILTADYELFFGTKTGSVQECMINPTNKLLDILDINNSKMTLFWDVLHYYKLEQYKEKYEHLKADSLLIENQIADIIKRGHDIQLHIHPHWLESR